MGFGGTLASKGGSPGLCPGGVVSVGADGVSGFCSADEVDAGGVVGAEAGFYCIGLLLSCAGATVFNDSGAAEGVDVTVLGSAGPALGGADAGA